MPKKIIIILLALILLLGGFLRIYRISEYMTFLGDEGRDVLVVKRMIIDHKFTLLGPITSVGSMYMGPIYYYFMVPFLWAWNFDPVGPSVMVAVFAVLTIFIIYKIGADFFHPSIGLISAFLYSLAPLAIISGRSSWNPNIVPFFAVSIIYSMLKVISQKKYNFLIIAGLSLGILLQLHYVTLIFLPIIIGCLYLIRFKIPLKIYRGAFLAMLATYSPFLMFEIRHGFVNLQSAYRFVIAQNSNTSVPFIIQLWNTVNDITVRLFWRLLIVSNAETAKLFIIFLAVSLVLYHKFCIKSKQRKLSFKILLIWLIVGIFSYSIYRGVIYDYYFGSLFALPFILAGIMMFTLWKISKFTKILSIFIFLFITYLFIKNSPLQYTPNNLLANTRKIAEFIYKEKGNKPYNFALIAGKNSDHAYRYFLELWGSPPVVIENPAVDSARKTVTSQLMIVCEEKICQPLGHPLWEIAGFGQAEIAGQWKVVTAEVFKLIPYKGI